MLVEEELLEEEEWDEMMVIGLRTLSLARSARACRGWLAVDGLGSTALDLPLAWRQLCRL